MNRRFFATGLGLMYVLFWIGNRANADIFDPSSILSACQDTITERTLSGAILQSIPVPYPAGPRPTTEYVRDFVVMENGNLAIINGTFNPYLSIYDPTLQTWTHTTFPGWSFSNNGFMGSICAVGPYVFVNDQRTSLGDGLGEARGAIRFDTRDLSGIRFSTFRGQTAVCIGYDGLLYVTGNGTTGEDQVDVYDPISLQQYDPIIFPDDIDPVDMAVTAERELVFTTHDDTLEVYDTSGHILRQRSIFPIQPSDMDLSPDGRVLYTTRLHGVFETDLALIEPVSRFSTLSNTFISLPYSVPEPGMLALCVMGSALCLCSRRRS